MSAGHSGDEEQKASPGAAQNNRAQDGGTVYAVQYGDLNVYQAATSPGQDRFDQWERSLRRRPQELEIAEGQTLRLERSEALRTLYAAVQEAGEAAVVVRGEPGVGKSALVLRAVDLLRQDGALVWVGALHAMQPQAGALAQILEVALAPHRAALVEGRPGLLVVEGAEAVQEGLKELCAEAIDAAVAVGLTPVLVCRDDAAETVSELCGHSAAAKVTQVHVPPLDDAEICEVLRAAPQLAHLAGQDRSCWLLRRVLLIDLLLRSARRGAALPQTLVSEADVYLHVWQTLVLNRGESVQGAVPDDREAALVCLAEEGLTGQRATPPSGPARMSLRSDGLLAPLDQPRAGHGGHPFAHDVYRDFATAHRLLAWEDGIALLGRRAPRTAVRAGRIYCQVRLDPSRGGSVEANWQEVYRAFSELAAEYGPRWQEVPWEALLHAGWCEQVLSALSMRLRHEPVLVEQLLRCALRCARDAAEGALVLAPVVAWLVEQGYLRNGPQEDAASAVVLEWLRSVSWLEVGGGEVGAYRPLRAAVRTVALEAVRTGSSSQIWVEALALLGADRDEGAVAALREVMRGRPQELLPAIERTVPGYALAATAPDVLVELTLGYYLVAPEQRERYGKLFPEGVRRHERLGPPLYGWASKVRGPFLALLQHAPHAGLLLIRRLLEQVLEPYSSAVPALVVCGDFLGTGLREYPGHAAAWSWCHGALNGPQPCISALMALEAWLEQLIGAGAPVCAVARLAVERVGTIAGASLAYRLLVRHWKEDPGALVDFLALPEVWEMENARLCTGGDAEIPSPGRVTSQLVADALQSADAERLAHLQEVSRKLRAVGSKAVDPVALGNWADHLNPDQYAPGYAGDRRVIAPQPSTEIAEELGRRRARAARMTHRYDLLSRYALSTRGLHRVRVPELADSDHLQSDIARAQALAHAGEGQEAVCAVAAAVVVVAASGRTPSTDGVRWALEIIVAAAAPVAAEDATPGDVVLPWDERLLAALAVPLALLPAVAAPSPMREALIEVIRGCAADPARAVRDHFAEGARALWSVPCAAGGTCHHAVAWQAAEASVELAVQKANRVRCTQEPQRPPVTDCSQLIGDEDVLEELVSVLPVALEAAVTSHCRTPHARRLRTPLLEVYARSACFHGDADRERRPEEDSALCAALLRTTTIEPSVLTALVEQLAPSAGALSHLLHGLKLTATYETELIPALEKVWPTVMESVLTRPSAPVDNDASTRRAERRLREWQEQNLLDELAPNPTVCAAEQNVDGVLRTARERWLALAPLQEALEAWSTAKGVGRSAGDHLIGLLKSQPLYHQLDPGLRWVRQRLVNAEGLVEEPGYLLVEWLHMLRPELSAPARPHYQALVDGLALCGHPAGRALQQLDE
ncbi:ATP-binding protein [Streptomyces sp. ODS28]|uniref:ATP-binding protein n=1 Tax=Streptomyces sp. ODS28 TaxID=3136688 RepID=UPI0031E88B05